MKTAPEFTLRDEQNRRALGLSPQEYARRSRHSKSFWKGIGASVAALVAVGTFNFLNHSDQDVRNRQANTEQEALKETKTAWDSVVVLYEGATYRTAPEIVNPKDPAERNVDTIAGKVKPGEVLRVDKPVSGYKDENGDMWLAFASRGNVGSKETSLNDRVFWFNFNELNNQNENGKPLVQVYDYHRPSELGAVKVDLTDATTFISGDGSKGGPVGIASTMPLESFTNAVQQEQLQLAHK